MYKCKKKGEKFLQHVNLNSRQSPNPHFPSCSTPDLLSLLAENEVGNLSSLFKLDEFFPCFMRVNPGTLTACNSDELGTGVIKNLANFKIIAKGDRVGCLLLALIPDCNR